MKNCYLIICILSLIGVNSCSKDGSIIEELPQGTNFRVNYFTAHCTGVAEQECLLVQEGNNLGTKNWNYFYSSIEDFDFEPGFVYNLEIRKTKIDNPPADASSYKYSLLRLISKIPVACEFTNPNQDLDWLRFEIEKREANPTEPMQYCYISQAQVGNQIVFIYYDCNPRINKVVSVYNCLGGRITYLGGSIKKEDLKNEKVIWKPNNFQCNL